MWIRMSFIMSLYFIAGFLWIEECSKHTEVTLNGEYMGTFDKK